MNQVRRGVLEAAGALDRWLAGVTVVFVAAAIVRYLDRHGPDPVLAGAVLLAGVVIGWALGRPHRREAEVASVVIVVGLWAAVTLAAPSFAWVAVPLSFIVLRSLPLVPGGVTVLAMACVVVTAGWRLTERFDPTLVVGPLGLAGIAVAAYHALHREAEHRQSLLDDLTRAQERLAAEQRTVGALRERTRLAREIHDSVGQGLSSIVLLLDAARRGWETDPERARENVTMAEGSARHELLEVRRVIGDGRDVMIRIVLVDDHPVVRAGVRALLDGEPGFSVVGEAGDAASGVNLADTAAPDVVIVDLNLGAGADGIELTRAVRGLSPAPEVLVLTTYDTEADVVRSLDAGARGYLLKDVPADELFSAIRRTARGEPVLAARAAATLVRRSTAPEGAVTDREVDVLELLAQGSSNRDLARALFISEATVKSHLAHLYAKLGVDTRAAAVSAAIERRIIRHRD